MLRGLAHYRLLRRLGSGGQADAFLALDTRLKRRVCIKIYHLSGTHSQRRRAVEEARQLTRVVSPRTVDIYDVVSHRSRLALVMQYVPGCTLEDLLKRQRSLDASTAVALVSDVATALAGLRRAAVVHGDIKPANVLIDHHGRAVLADFGASRIAGEPLLAYSSAALSPEQSRGEGAALGSDFFALGLLLYQLLFATHPFIANNAVDVRALRRGLPAVPPLVGVSHSAGALIESLLLSLLAAEPSARPASTYELRESLRVIRTELPFPQPVDVGRLAPAALQTDAGSLPRLPKQLVRLPLWQHLRSAFAAYWSGGSPGARALLCTTALAPLALLWLLWARPGYCVAVGVPHISVMPGSRVVLPDEQFLRQRLTSLLKEADPRAMVLGAGAASDSRQIMKIAGNHDVCIAQRAVVLDVDCKEDRCLLQMRGYKGEALRNEQLSLAQEPNLRGLEQALAQLIDEQREFLLD